MPIFYRMVDLIATYHCITITWGMWIHQLERNPPVTTGHISHHIPLYPYCPGGASPSHKKTIPKPKFQWTCQPNLSLHRWRCNRYAWGSITIWVNYGSALHSICINLKSAFSCLFIVFFIGIALKFQLGLTWNLHVVVMVSHLVFPPGGVTGASSSFFNSMPAPMDRRPGEVWGDEASLEEMDKSI